MTALVRFVPSAATLTAGDNTVALGHTATRYLVRNRSGRTVYVEADSTASTDSTAVLHSRTLVVDADVTNLHVYVTADTSLDDTTEAGVEVVGWLSLAAAFAEAVQGAPGADGNDGAPGPVMGYGLTSARPAAGTVGRTYYSTDDHALSRDNGTSWNTLAWS